MKRSNGEGYIYKRRGTWYCQITLGYDLDGKRKTRTKGGFATRKEASAYIATMDGSAYTVKPDITFQGLYLRWYEGHAEKVSKSTMDCYRAAYKYFEDIYYMQFAEIKTAHFQGCIDACPHGGRTKENMKALGTQLCRYAIENDIIEKNYASFAYVKHEKGEERKPFSVRERMILWQAVGHVPNVEYVLCLMYTGLRPNEFLKLKKADFYGDYFVGGSKTAKGIDRIVTISPKIKGFIEALVARNGNGYIFSPNGKKLGEKKFYQMYYKVLEDCHLERKEPYCCRHTFASMMKDVKAADTDKMELMGHTSMEMTAHYTHADIESLKKITDMIG